MKNKGHVFWYYGLSGAGKSALSQAVAKKIDHQFMLKNLDGDELRKGLNNDLGFSVKDRDENLRRTAEVAKLFIESGFVVQCSFITPLIEQRNLIRQILGESVSFILVDTPLNECERRDPKGLYKKARTGEIREFTGVSQPFESEGADLVIIPDDLSIQVKIIEQFINEIIK